MQTETRPGRQLPNGAIILLHSPFVDATPDVREAVVLAVFEGGFQPFVTWRRAVGEEQRATGGTEEIDYCWSGSYHTHLEDALFDYNERSASLAQSHQVKA